MKTGVVRRLTQVEVEQVLAATGVSRVGWHWAVGFAYTHQGWAHHYAHLNRERLLGDGSWVRQVVGPVRLAGRPVSVLLVSPHRRVPVTAPGCPQSPTR